MKNKPNNSTKVFQHCLLDILILYLLLLLRIVLFKQAPLYNLPAAFGASERSVNIFPFGSVYDMIRTGISLSRIAENTLGNILLFVPLGLILAELLGKYSLALLTGFCFSLCIETAQFVLGLGSTDIDDLIFNTLGTAAGILMLRRIRKRFPLKNKRLAIMTCLLTASGLCVFAWLLVNHTDLFQLSPKKVVTENEELVADFIDSSPYLTGKFIRFSDGTLTVEKSVRNAGEPREHTDIGLTPDSRIFVCRQRTEYFFSAITKEIYDYSQLDYPTFSASVYGRFDLDNNVQIWSADGKKVDSILIIESTDGSF